MYQLHSWIRFLVPQMTFAGSYKLDGGKLIGWITFTNLRIGFSLDFKIR
jgi:hypothetical protein